MGTERMAVEVQRKRAKRSPTFTADEIRILVGEVWLQRDTLFGGTNEKKHILAKNRVWSLIAQRLAPSSPCGLRDWKTVRKKWQEFQSQTKKKMASVKYRGRDAPGGSDHELSPEEETALAIIDKIRSEATEEGVEVRMIKQLLEPKDEPCDSVLEPAPIPAPAPPTSSTPSTDYDSDVTQLPAASEQPVGPAITSVRTLVGHAQTNVCGCSETLLELEREKVETLRRIERHLERSTALQQEMVDLKRQKLELQRRSMPLVAALSGQPLNGRTIRRGVSQGRSEHTTQCTFISK